MRYWSVTWLDTSTTWQHVETPSPPQLLPLLLPMVTERTAGLVTIPIPNSILFSFSHCIKVKNYNTNWSLASIVLSAFLPITAHSVWRGWTHSEVEGSEIKGSVLKKLIRDRVASDWIEKFKGCPSTEWLSLRVILVLNCQMKAIFYKLVLNIAQNYSNLFKRPNFKTWGH